ncbi:hypothetical protein [Mycolicibacterium phocaicum]|uniref:hypothetical protein n=2 Tax=Mycobacteriaceae TaxID=1762 RepID=UPI001CFBC5AA|nr:hypothetical protein [Mycolicibacterium phocaicum]UCZ60072.1 hypothetical protein LHJ73_25995 [Mycolicibacterium phocaicum]
MGETGFGIALLGLVAMAVAAFRDDPATAARIYWTGAAITTAAATLIGIPRGWSGALEGLLLSVCLILLCTYVRTPYLKVGGKTRTLFSAEPEPYGMNLSTPKTWWLLVVVAMVFIYPVLALIDDGVRDWKLVAYVAGTVLVGMRFGYLDRLLGNPITAGQYIQFALISILTVGVFPVGYLAMYYGGRRLIAKSVGYGQHSRRRT